MDEISLNFLIVAIFYLVPILLVILFIIFLFVVTVYRYLSARKKNKQNPDTFSDEEFKIIKREFVIASILFGTLFGIMMTFIIWFLSATPVDEGII